MSLFKTHRIVPDVLNSWPPQVLSVEFGPKALVDLGNALELPNVKNEPSRLHWQMENDSFYTLLMVDPDASAVSSALRSASRERVAHEDKEDTLQPAVEFHGEKELEEKATDAEKGVEKDTKLHHHHHRHRSAAKPCFLHWLLVNIPATAGDGSKIHLNKGHTVVHWMRPNPPGSHSFNHRYVFLVYKQAQAIDILKMDPVEHRNDFHLEEWMHKTFTSLPQLEAGNFFYTGHAKE